VSKIFRTGATIYTAVVVVWSTGPNRPNCEFRVLLWLLLWLCENMLRCRPKLRQELNWLLHHDNAPSHTSVLNQHFWRNIKWLSSPTHCTPDLAPCDYFLYPKNESETERTPVWYHWEDSSRIAESIWHCLKRTSRKHSKNVGVGGTGVYMREGTTSRVMAADRPYGEFYDFCSVSPEYFGYSLMWLSDLQLCNASWLQSRYNKVTINLLKTKCTLLYLRNQSVPCCKHYPAQL
jgi:hypothetical protein